MTPVNINWHYTIELCFVLVILLAAINGQMPENSIHSILCLNVTKMMQVKVTPFPYKRLEIGFELGLPKLFPERA